MQSKDAELTKLVYSSVMRVNSIVVHNLYYLNTEFKVYMLAPYTFYQLLLFFIPLTLIRNYKLPTVKHELSCSFSNTVKL